MMSMQSMARFASWVKRNDPTVYALAAKRHALKTGGKEVYALAGYNGGLHGLEDFFNTLTDTVKNVLPSVVQYKAQSKILDAQLQRAKMGLSPLNVEDYSPVMRVSPSFDPSSEAALTRMAIQTTQSGIQKLIPVALVGVGAYLWLNRKRKR